MGRELIGMKITMSTMVLLMGLIIYGVNQKGNSNYNLIRRYNQILVNHADYDKNKIITQEERIKLWKEVIPDTNYSIIGTGSIIQRRLSDIDIDISLIDRKGYKKYLYGKEKLNLLEKFVEKESNLISE